VITYLFHQLSYLPTKMEKKKEIVFNEIWLIPSVKLQGFTQFSQIQCIFEYLNFKYMSAIP